MADLIDKERKVIEILINIFNDKFFQENLELQAKSIETVFKSLLNTKGNDYELISKNTVRDLKFFSLIHRIKEDDSLKEKFYRANLLHTKFHKFRNKNKAFILNSKADIENIFQRCEDIIGVKILTDLNEDCKKVLYLLKTVESESILKKKGIILNKKDLQSQPAIMKNGLEIYKIRGIYNNIADFELQIKSKMVSAWGDMEHSIFYKDYFISPVRESTQATMNHIGKLVFQIDDFLLSVRHANKLYVNKAEVTNFLSRFDLTYSKIISEKLGGIGFKLDVMSEALFYIYKNKFPKINFANKVLETNHYNLKSTHQIYKYYIKIREGSYDLKIFESIIFGWQWINPQINLNNIDSFLDKYFKYIYEYLSDGVVKNIPGNSQKEITKTLKYYFKNILQFSNGSNLFLSSAPYVKHFNLMNFLNEELELYLYSKPKNKTLETFKEKCFSILSLLFINVQFEGDIQQQIIFLNLEQSIKNKLIDFLKKFTLKVKVRSNYTKELYITEQITKFLGQ